MVKCWLWTAQLPSPLRPPGTEHLELCRTVSLAPRGPLSMDTLGWRSGTSQRPPLSPLGVTSPAAARHPVDSLSHLHTQLKSPTTVISFLTFKQLPFRKLLFIYEDYFSPQYHLFKGACLFVSFLVCWFCHGWAGDVFLSLVKWSPGKSPVYKY